MICILQDVFVSYPGVLIRCISVASGTYITCMTNKKLGVLSGSATSLQNRNIWGSNFGRVNVVRISCTVSGSSYQLVI
jgi:hypothetical protein